MRRGREITHNAHHLWFNRADYQEQYYSELRETSKVEMRFAGHVALHKAVEPPPKPSFTATVDFLNDYFTDNPSRGIESFEYTEEWFATSYLDKDIDLELQEHHLLIANNVARQLSFIRGNLWQK